MKQESSSFGKGERPRRVYMVSLEVEVWPAGEARPKKPRTYTATEISLSGFHLLCHDPTELPYRFNFAVLFPKRATAENLQLIIGVARIIRREQRFDGNESYGVAAKIEQIDKMWEGEEEKAS